MEHSIAHTSNGAGPGHEEREVKVRTIIVSLAFLALGTFIVFVLVVGIFRYLHATVGAETAQPAVQQLPPEPRVEVAPYQQLQTLRAHEDHVLGSYAWVDQKAGTVRVPIDRAIDMVAQKGLASHNYLDDILAGRKPPMPPKQPEPAAKQGTSAK